METSFRANVKLTAIIYLHPIVNDRLEGSALDNLSVFRKLCGPDFYPNIVLATTFWSAVTEAVGSRRETELRETDEFWGGMIRKGSQMTRLPDDRSKCIELLMRLSHKNKGVLQIQRELVTESRSIGQTEAGSSARNIRALENLREEFNKRLIDFSEQQKAEQLKQKTEFERLRQEQEDAFEEQIRKNREIIEQQKRENEALLKAAEERRRKALEEHEEHARQTKLETERLQAQLERLALEEKDRDERRKNEQKQHKFKLRIGMIQQKAEAQFGLCSTAIEAGTIKIALSTNWFLELQVCSFCNVCENVCSVQLCYCKSISLGFITTCTRICS